MNWIQTEYSPYFIILCLAIGAAYSLFLYFRDSKWKDKPAWIAPTLALGRFLLVSLLCFLLLSPFATFFNEKIVEPTLILAYDGSESMELTDSAIRSKIEEKYLDIKQQYGAERVDMLRIGGAASPTDSFDYKAKETNLNAVFDHIEKQYAGQEIAGLILASDGIYNIGANPIYHSKLEKIPVYSIPLGDSSSKKDVALKDVFYNKFAYYGDEFIIQADIIADQFQGKQTTLYVDRKEQGRWVNKKQKAISIGKNNYFETLDFQLPADKEGIHQYRVRILPLSGEVNTLNNTRRFSIEIINARTQVAIIGAAPHPDMGAIKQLLENNDNFEVSILTKDQEASKINEMDVLVLHQIPNRGKGSGLIQTALKSKLPSLYIVGQKTDPTAFNKLKTGIEIKYRGGKPNFVKASYNQTFNAFRFNKKQAKPFQYFPEMQSLFADFNASPSVKTVFYQQIGEVQTKFPLIALNEVSGRRSAFVLGEGIWRWRLSDYIQNESQENISFLFSQLLQYLSVKEDKRRFKVFSPKNLFAENERIKLRAELLNENFELINTADVFLKVSDQKGNTYDYTFSKINNFYSLDMGYLMPGIYSYQASTKLSGKDFNYNGAFTLEQLDKEKYQTKANYNLMQLLAERSGGKLVSIEQLDSLIPYVTASDAHKPKLYYESRTQSFIELPWLFLLLFLLMALEWIGRRLAGTY